MPTPHINANGQRTGIQSTDEDKTEEIKGQNGGILKIKINNIPEN